jgi:hypothetical protein
MTKYHKDGTLPQNGEVFVFGSNLAGIHGAGAAKVAREQFGAPMGAGMGLMGKAYAIPTKDWHLDTIDLAYVELFVKQFIDITQLFCPREFFVTRVGCGLAGYKDEDIAPLFKGAKNCSFANEWRQYLESP